MSFVLREKVLKLILPAAGYVLALGALAVLAAPAISKIQKLWNAEKLPVVEEQTPARPSSRTLVARSTDSWSSATPSILSETSNSGISLPKPAEEEEPQQNFGIGDSALAQQGYMPLLEGNPGTAETGSSPDQSASVCRRKESAMKPGPMEPPKRSWK